MIRSSRVCGWRRAGRRDRIREGDSGGRRDRRGSRRGRCGNHGQHPVPAPWKRQLRRGAAGHRDILPRPPQPARLGGRAGPNSMPWSSCVIGNEQYFQQRQDGRLSQRRSRLFRPALLPGALTIRPMLHSRFNVRVPPDSRPVPVICLGSDRYSCASPISIAWSTAARRNSIRREWLRLRRREPLP